MTFASDLAHAVHGGDRRALSKAITLVESSRPDDAESARELLSLLTPVAEPSFRIGVTGVPGAGKSTLIDALGRHAINDGRRVAVLAVDPSSRDSGGSLLGDKTRMTQLSVEPAAFIRPSPTLGVLGGTAGRTREVIILCEAAGYDLIFVETVGVGQSEERVASMVDCVLLVLLAGAGDELSSMKRGVLEAADVIAFNKADGGRVSAVEADAASLRASLGISRGSRLPAILTLSALESTGIDALWATLLQQHAEAGQQGTLERRRVGQRKAWFEAALQEALHGVFTNNPELSQALVAAERDVESGALSAPEAAQRLVLGLLARRGE
jgi:LAO/AO transport system kinase